MSSKILVLPGDGIGVEVANQATHRRQAHRAAPRRGQARGRGERGGRAGRLRRPAHPQQVRPGARGG